MKLRKIFITVAIAIATVANAVTQGNGTITVKASKVMCPLAEQWIRAYKSVNPNINIIMVGKDEEANLVLGFDNGEGYATNVGRIAVLPVTPSDNPLIKDIQNKEWSGKDIKRLFFQTEEEQYEDKDRLSKRERLAGSLTVITGNSKASASTAFAKNFGFSRSDLRGKRIAGDDIYLLKAIEKNKQSVTFNAISNLFDLNSRQLKSNISLFPLDVKKELAEALSSGNLDNALNELEKQVPDLVVTERVSFTYRTFNTDIEAFLQWVLSDGQQINHSAGVLRLDSKNLKSELLALSEK